MIEESFTAANRSMIPFHVLYPKEKVANFLEKHEHHFEKYYQDYFIFNEFKRKSVKKSN